MQIIKWSVNLSKRHYPIYKMKKFLKILLVIIIVCASFFLLYISNNYVVPIVMYHHVSDADKNDVLYVSPEKFEYHMTYLNERRYNVISLDDYVKATLEGKSFPRKTVVLTFDDAFDDFYENALAILKKYEFPATVFTPSDLMDERGQMTFIQLKALVDNGIDIGSHTRTHVYLPQLSPHQQKNQITESKRILEEKLGISVNHFAYPVGGFSNKIKAFVKEAGYMSASTTNRGFDRSNKDIYELKRIRFSNKDKTDDILWIKLSGYYNLFRKAKNPN